MRDEGEGNVTIALTVLIELFGLAMMVFERFIETEPPRCVSHRDAQRAQGVYDVSAVNGETQRIEPVLPCNGREQSLAHQSTSAVDCATAHPGLA